MPHPTFLNLPAPKRDRVTKVAIQEFAAHTYAGASISRMVAQAGIAKGSFYQYFDGKIDLYRWLIFDVVVRRKLAFIEAAGVPEAGDWWTDLSHLMLSGIRFGLANPLISRLAMSIWYPPQDAQLRDLYTQIQVATRTQTQALLSQGQRGGHVRDDLDIDVATDLLMAITRQGLDLAIERKVGVDLISFCSQPQLAAQFPDDEQVVLIEQIVDLLRRAMGTPGSNSGPRLQLRELPALPWNQS